MSHPLTGHTVHALKFPPYRSGIPAVLRCLCGTELRAYADLALPDPWSPVPDAWQAHRGPVTASLRKNEGAAKRKKNPRLFRGVA